jgi:hypothetical protein
MAELGTRLRETGLVVRATTLRLLTTIAMFARNLLLATIFFASLSECDRGMTGRNDASGRFVDVAGSSEDVSR